MMETVSSIIGPYRIVRMLGEGGMGAVYEAVHQTIGRRVAIKILHAEFSRNEEVISRFFNEARAVNIVEHPGIVQISDYGQLSDGTAYIVMEYLKGESLAKRLASAGGVLLYAEVLQIGWQIADSLAAAHEQGIVHRDLKPDNIMMVPDPHMPIGERTKLLDFGIAKLSPRPGESKVRTRTNTVMGTPRYMSPEQCRGAGAVDSRSDVYSLGVMLYQMLAGRTPFEADAPGELMVMHLRDVPPPIQQFVPTLPPKVVELIDGLLCKDPASRPSMREVATALMYLQSSHGAQQAASIHREQRASEPASAARDYGEGAAIPAHKTTLLSATGQSLSKSTDAQSQQRQRWAVTAALGGLLLLGITGSIWLLRYSRDSRAADRPAVPVSAPMLEQASRGLDTPGPAATPEPIRVQPAAMRVAKKSSPPFNTPPTGGNAATATASAAEKKRPKAPPPESAPIHVTTTPGTKGAVKIQPPPSSSREAMPTNKRLNVYDVD